MFRAFSTALIATLASARGAGDGSTEVDAWSTNLIDQDGVTLDAHFWNEKNGETWELFSELNLTYDDKSPDLKLSVLLKIPDQTTYDAYSITGASLKASPQFGVIDGHIDSAQIGPIDPDTVLPTSTNPASGWIGVSQTATCTDGATAGKLNCEITTKSKRNFTTGGTEAENEDVQLTEAQKGDDFKVYGFVAFANSQDASVQAETVPATLPSNLARTQLVSNIVDASADGTTPVVDTSGGSQGGNGGSGQTSNNSTDTTDPDTTEPGTDGTNTTATNETAANSTDATVANSTEGENSEGATSVTTFGAAVLAAITALAF